VDYRVLFQAATVKAVYDRR